MPVCLLPGLARPLPARDAQACCCSCSASTSSAAPARPMRAAASVAVRRKARHTPPAPDASPPGTHLHALDADDAAPGYGPRGVLMVGLSAADAAAVEAWFHAMEPGFAVSHCSGAMLDGSVRQAVLDEGTNPPSFRVTPFTTRLEEKLPRLALFGGMAPQEVVAIAEHWTTFTGTADPVLVTLLPGMLDRALEEVVLEATRAAASARATGGRGVGPGGDVERMDGAALKAAVRAKVEQRRAGRGRGPVQLDVGGGHGGSGGGRSAGLSRADALELGATGSVVVPAGAQARAPTNPGPAAKGRRPATGKAATAKGFGKK